MIETWNEFDQYVEKDLAKEYARNGMLRGHLTVLLVKRLVSYQTPVEEIQQALNERYDVEYDPSDIEDELYLMVHEDETEIIQQDFFEGY